MVGDLAMEQPRPDIVRAHIDDLGGRGKQLDGVGPRPPAQRRIAVPMNSVDIGLVAKADQLPSDPLAAAHGETIEIVVKQTIDRVFLVALSPSCLSTIFSEPAKRWMLRLDKGSSSRR